MTTAFGRDGKRFELPAHEAAAAFLRGDVELQAGTKVPVRAPDGKVGYMPVEALFDAVHAASPYQLATEGDVEKYRTEQRRGGTLQQAQTFAEGAASGLTMGLAPAIVSHTIGEVQGSPIAARRQAIAMRERAEAHPITSIAGEVGGIVAGELLTGGAAPSAEMATARMPGLLGRARRGAELVTAIPGATSRLGARAEAAVLGAMPEATTVLGRVGQRALGGATRGAVETLPYAVGHAVSDAVTEDALGNPDVVSERLLAGVGLETLAGGMAGGILGGTGRLIGEGIDAVRAKAPQAIESIAAHRFGHVAPGLGEKLVQASAALSGKDAGIIRRLAFGTDDATEAHLTKLLSKEARAARRVAFRDSEAVRETALETLTRDLGELRSASDVAQAPFRKKGGAKTKTISSLLRQDNAAEQVAATRTVLGEVRNTIDQVAEMPGINAKLRRNVRELNQALEQQTKRLDDAITQSDQAAVAEGYAALDSIKAHLGEQVKAVNKIVTKTKSPTMMEVGPDIAHRFDAMQRRIATQLEDEALYGTAGTAQQQINAAWKRLIDAEKNMAGVRLYQPKSTGYETQWEANPEAIGAYLDGLTNPRKNLVHGRLREWLDSSEAFVASARKHGGFSGDEAKRLDAFADRVSAVRKTLDETTDAMTLRNQARELLGGDEGRSAALLGGVIGGVIGGVGGGAAGAALGLASNPGRALRQLASLERLSAIKSVDVDVQKKLSRAVDLYVKKMWEPAAKAGRAAAVRTSAVSAERKWRNARKLVDDARRNPERIKEQVARSMRHVAPAAPNITSATQSTVDKAFAYLSKKLPSDGDPSRLTPHLDQPRTPSKAELESFRRIYDAVTEGPEKLLRELRSGDLSHETVDAIREVYPSSYEEIKTMVQERLAEARRPVPYQQRIRLGLLFDFAADRSMTPESVMFLQSTYARHKPGPRPRPKAGSALKDISETYQSRMDSLEV